MRGYLLDTSICVFLLRGVHSIEERLNEIDQSECYITDAVVAELMFGAYYSDRVEENLRQVEDFVAEMWSEGHSFFMYRSDSVDSLASCYIDDHLICEY